MSKEKVWRCVCLKFLICLVIISGNCKAIILSNQELPKPAYTSGIKTTNWRNPNLIQTNQNYSKVYVHNNPNNAAQYVVTTAEKSEKVYPVYNAHAYGRQAEETRWIVEPNLQTRNWSNRVGGNLGGTHNNRTIYKRKIEYKTIEVYEKCPEGATGSFVYYLSCNQFLNCWKGRGDVQNCAPGTLFNPKTLECDFPGKVECVTSRQNSISLETTRSQKSFTQATCPKEFSGLIPNYTDCSKFISCNNGQQASMDCPPGTLFDTTQNVCNFPYLTTCFNGQRGDTSSDNQYTYDRNRYEGQASSFQTTYQGQNYPSSQTGGHQFGYQHGSQYHQNSQQQGVNSKLDFGESNTQQTYSRLNSQQQGVNSKLDFGESNAQQTYGQGLKFYIQSTRGTSCNPQIQMCRPATQPQAQNFGESTTVNCDPRFQNCDGTSFQYGYGQTPCNPQIRNCGQGYGSTDRSFSTTQRTSPNQQNYHRICNIGDTSCQKNSSIARKTKPKCPDNFQGITKHPSDCKKFLNCANGMTFIQDCAPGTLFNPALGNCDFPYNVDCSSNEAVEETGGVAESDWQAAYNSHAQRYGQNAGHGNVRVETTSRPQYYGTNQEQGGYQHSQFYNRNDGNGGVKTTHSQGRGSGVTVLQPLTPRPIQPAETVLNRGQIGLVHRPTYSQTNPFDRRTNARDYPDVFNGNLPVHSTTVRSAGKWPPPFPSTDVNADYVYEYEDGEPVTVEPENVFKPEKKVKQFADCDKLDFYCSTEMCVTVTAVCDGHRDCHNGKDELECQKYSQLFTLSKNSQLDILEDQRWVNVTETTCALLCVNSKDFVCRSFNYRKIDRTCFLSNLNIGLTGALRQYYPYDYYELKSASIDCMLLFKCNSNKCIDSHLVCDGFGDCSDREDEKNCKAEDFGYSVKLTGSTKKSEGRVEVQAFGKTGYICDDQFGIKDANVICKELGFHLGAAEVRGHSYYAADLKEKNTLYMIDDLNCYGNESTLLDCNFPGWGVHDCRDQEIAGLVCKTPQRKCGKGHWKCDSGDECIPYGFLCDGLFDCTDDSDESVQHCQEPTQMRLVNGASNRDGRVEIKHHGVWGTVCDDDFNEDAAKVVCKYFGFTGTVTVKKEAYFGPGDGPIWLDQVSCNGNETELRKCTNWNWGEHNCDHNEDVGVICSNEIQVTDPVVELLRHSKVIDAFGANVQPPISCGFRKDNQFLLNDLIHTRLVSGSVARKGDYPWQAALRIKGKAQQSHHWCGAVILSSRWVLTAAHCLEGYAKGAYMVVAGEYNTDEDEGTEQKKYIEEYFIHENFTEGERVMKNDIALIKVKGTGFTLNNDVQPICLPDEDVDYERELNCTISGFGSVKTGNSAYSHNLMAAWIPIIGSDICRMPHVYDTAMAEGMICAGFLNGGIDSCHGDSGGPLACLDNGLFTLYGITSWGHRCGLANKPGVYVKVAHYRRWIDDTMKNN